MNKLPLAIFLLIVVIIVSYLKVMHDRSKEVAIAQVAGRQAGDSLAAAHGESDSLRQVVVQLYGEYADSMKYLRESAQTRVDSLEAVIDSARVSRPTTRVEPQQKSSKGNAEDARKKREQQIAAYYKGRYRDLPTDLTEYEHNAAITEIRVETAEKFGISLAELNRIRQRHNLEY